MSRSLTRASLADACRELARRDPLLAAIHAEHGTPPLWGRRPGFATLARIVLEQQVSLASAHAIHRRVLGALGTLTPEGVLALGEPGLRALGLTRQKARYWVALARSVADGALDLSAVARLDDESARARLTAELGIGAWTAECYLLMALRRPDAWPAGDIALAAELAHRRGRRQRPDPEQLTRHARPWRPWRAAAARLLWASYLARLGRA